MNREEMVAAVQRKRLEDQVVAKRASQANSAAAPSPASPAVSEEQALLDSQLEGLFGETAPPTEAPETTAGDYAKAAGSLVTAATTGAAGQIGGSIEGIVGSIVDGTYGTPEGAQSAAETAAKRREQLTYTPDTEGGKHALNQAVSALEPLQALEAVAPMFAPNQIAASARLMAKPARAGLSQSVERLTEKPYIKPDQPVAPLRTAANRLNKSAGAAEAEQQLQRAASAAELPIPMTGDRAPTLAQLQRNFSKLQEEAELAKRAEIGEPLRIRKQNQMEGINANLQQLEDQFESAQFENRGTGQALSGAVQKLRDDKKAGYKAAYAAADEAGELADEITIAPTADVLLDTQRFNKLAGNAQPILAEAKRLGVVDANGKPTPIPLRDAETFRQYINKATDFADGRESMIRSRWLDILDPAMDSGGGAAYKQARALFKEWDEEFNKTKFNRDLTAVKRNSNERVMPYEKSFDRIIKDGSLDEIRKLRTTLSNSPEGEQAWTDLRAATSRYVAEQARGTRTDAAGNPVISAAALKKVVQKLDDSGKLEEIYGKQGAEQVRQLVEVADTVLTAPPGAVNHSNTSSAVVNALTKIGAAKIPIIEKIPEALNNYALKRSVRKALELPEGELKGYLEDR